MIESIELPRGLDNRPIPHRMIEMIEDVTRRIEIFQDRWDSKPIEQFVAADYRLVYQALDWIAHSQLLIGNRFIEWGSGFSAVAVMAAQFGWETIAIEHEEELIEHGKETIDQWAGVPIELVRGNFLPSGAERLADDPTLPSLNHGGPCAYEQIGLHLDDFAIVYSYPWPGEDDFHEFVFDRYATRGAILMNFRGPQHIALWRKVK